MNPIVICEITKWEIVVCEITTCEVVICEIDICVIATCEITSDEIITFNYEDRSDDVNWYRKIYRQ